MYMINLLSFLRGPECKYFKFIALILWTNSPQISIETSSPVFMTRTVPASPEVLPARYLKIGAVYWLAISRIEPYRLHSRGLRASNIGIQSVSHKPDIFAGNTEFCRGRFKEQHVWLPHGILCRTDRVKRRLAPLIINNKTSQAICADRATKSSSSLILNTKSTAGGSQFSLSLFPFCCGSCQIFLYPKLHNFSYQVERNRLI
jgi:hypothetical protein